MHLARGADALSSTPLYAVGRRDLVYGILPTRYVETVSGTDTGFLVTTGPSQEVERQYVVQLTYLGIQMDGAGAEQPYDWVLKMLDKSVTTGHVIAAGINSQTGAVRSRWGFGMRLEQTLLEGQNTIMTTNWSAAVANNTVAYTLWGWKIPRGNMQGEDIRP